MKVGDLVKDHAIGMTGVIINTSVVLLDDHPHAPAGDMVEWEFAVLYESGTIHGADTKDLEIIR